MTAYATFPHGESTLSLHLAFLSSPRRRGPIRRSQAMWHRGRKVESLVVMGPRLRGDDRKRVRGDNNKRAKRPHHPAAQAPSSGATHFFLSSNGPNSGGDVR